MPQSQQSPRAPMPRRARSLPADPTELPEYLYRPHEEVADWVQSNSSKRKRSEPLDPPAKKRQRVDSVAPSTPLTAEALRLLNRAESLLQQPDDMDSQSSFTNDSSGVINAYNNNFSEELRRRGIYILEEDNPLQPSNYDDFRNATAAKRLSPELDDDDAAKVRRRVYKSVNEAAAIQSLLPKVLQLDFIWDSTAFMTVPDQLWDRKACLPPLPTGNPIPVPKPDQTVGWRNTEFPLDKALAILRPYAAPVQTAQLLFPYFTVEGKGDAGNLKVSRLQNAHNGAVMLFDLWQVQRAACKETEFLDKIQVVTMCLTTESVELSYHWATMTDGKIRFYSKVFDCWSLNNKSSSLLTEARRTIRNAFDWLSSETRKRIETDLLFLEELDDLGRIAALGRIAEPSSSELITPPNSQPGANAKLKRQLSKVGQAGKNSRSRSSSGQRKLTQ